MDPNANRSNESYRQILKSTTIIGGSSVIDVILRIIRTKCIAVLLGPAGIGLLGIFNAITVMVGTIVGMGLDSSGLRKIAEAAGAGNDAQIARTVVPLRRVVWVLGLSGMILLILLSSPMSRLTFENTDHTSDVILLSIVILFMTVMNGEVILIQGMRRIGDLAKLNILKALFGTLLSIPIIYVWGQKGIVPFLIAASAVGCLTAWWYARKVNVSHVQMGWVEIWNEVKHLLNLGSAFMLSALMVNGTTYLLTVLVTRRLSLEAVGLYQAAVILSSTYVGFILDSMVKDYLPRLSAIANDHAACNKLVNEQVEIGILLSVPGILATLTFAPLIIQFFYTSEFVAAFEILRWQILGILLQVASWPISFILQAKGRGQLVLLTVSLACVVHVCLIWVGMSYFGLKGTGMAFFGMWTFYGIIIYGVARYLTGFTLSGANIRIALVTLPAIGIVFVSGLNLEDFWSMTVGSTISVAMAVYSIMSLVDYVSPNGYLSSLVKIKERFWGRVW